MTLPCSEYGNVIQSPVSDTGDVNRETGRPDDARQTHLVSFQGAGDDALDKFSHFSKRVKGKKNNVPKT